MVHWQTSYTGNTVAVDIADELDYSYGEEPFLEKLTFPQIVKKVTNGLIIKKAQYNTLYCIVLYCLFLSCRSYMIKDMSRRHYNKTFSIQN